MKLKDIAATRSVNTSVTNTHQPMDPEIQALLNARRFNSLTTCQAIASDELAIIVLILEWIDSIEAYQPSPAVMEIIASLNRKIDRCSDAEARLVPATNGCVPSGPHRTA